MDGHIPASLLVQLSNELVHLLNVFILSRVCAALVCAARQALAGVGVPVLRQLKASAGSYKTPAASQSSHAVPDRIVEEGIDIWLVSATLLFK